MSGYKKIFDTLNKKEMKRQKARSVLHWLSNNILAILALIISIIALVKP